MGKAWRCIKAAVGWLLNGLAIALFVAIFLVVLLQVLMRYGLGTPLIWSEELARYLFVWISFIGWVLAARNKSHIRIAVVEQALPGRLKRPLRAVHATLTLAFALALGGLGCRTVQSNLDVPTVTLGVPYALVYLAVPLTGLLLAFQALLDLFESFRSPGEARP
jgi:TRAP-type C4-dicarboxylate transport system permease small subunit